MPTGRRSERSDSAVNPASEPGQSRADVVSAVCRIVERTRDAIGPHKELMIDAWMRWDEATTLEIADEIERLRTLVADNTNKPVMEVRPVTSELVRRWT